MTNVDMDSRLSDKHAAMRPIPVYIAPGMGERDQIRVADVWRVIVRRKAIILLSLLLSMLPAVAYLVFAEPVYKANAYLLPPQQKDIQGLLIDYRGIEEDIGVNRYTPEGVYGAFLDSLKSQGVRREFFDNQELIKHYAAGKSAKDINTDRIFEKLFNERLKVYIDKQNTSFVTVSFSDRDPVLAAQWLNQIIDFSNKRTIHQLSSNVNSAIKSEIGRARFQLDSKLKLAEKRRRDRVADLKEALQAAESIGINDLGALTKNTKSPQSELVINTAQIPLYMRGTRALKAEISVLEARKSDEPFIRGFRDLQERRAFLEGISTDPDMLSAVTVDAAARVPYRADKPRRTLILIFAAALGLMVGVSVALFNYSAYRECRKV